MTVDNLRERLMAESHSGRWYADDDPVIDIHDVPAVVAVWLQSDATVERVALRIAAQKRPGQHGQLCPCWTRKKAVESCDCWILKGARVDARFTLAAALASEEAS